MEFYFSIVLWGIQSYLIFWSLSLVWQHLSLLFLYLRLLDEYLIPVFLSSISLNSFLISVASFFPLPAPFSRHFKGMSQFGSLLNRKYFVHSSPLCSLTFYWVFSFFFGVGGGRIILISQNCIVLCRVIILYFVDVVSSELLLKIPIRYFYPVLFPWLSLLLLTCSACSTWCLYFRLLVFFNHLVIFGCLPIYRWSIPLIDLKIL